MHVYNIHDAVIYWCGTGNAAVESLVGIYWFTTKTMRSQKNGPLHSLPSDRSNSTMRLAQRDDAAHNTRESHASGHRIYCSVQTRTMTSCAQRNVNERNSIKIYEWSVLWEKIKTHVANLVYRSKSSSEACGRRRNIYVCIITIIAFFRSVSRSTALELKQLHSGVPHHNKLLFL